MKKLATLLLIAAMLASFVAACAAPTPEVIEREVVVEKPVVETVVVEREVVVEKPVVETVVVEKEKIVEKPVVETVVVEKVVKETVEVVVEPTPEPKPKEPKTLVMMSTGEPNVGLDPTFASTALSVGVLTLMHDPLVEFDKDWKPIPWIAESWETNEDASEWTFHLRDGLFFSDGSPLTAEDVKYSFEKMKEGPVHQAALMSLESIEVKDPLTIVLTFSRSLPEFLYLAASQVGYFTLSKAACEGGACGNYTQPGLPVSGPWYLKEYVTKSHLVLEKNPYYGFPGLPKIERVHYSFSGDRAGNVAAVQAGTADYYGSFPSAFAEELSKDPNVQIFIGRRVDQFRGWGFDKSKPPFNDKRVRQALGYAIEPDEISETCWFGLGQSLWGGYFYEQDLEWFPILGRTPWKGKTREERLAIADELLTAAGWEDRDGDGIRESYGVEGLPDGTKFEVTAMYERPWLQSGCHALLCQDYWKDIGLNMIPEGQEKANYWPDVRAGKFQMWHIGSGSSPLPWEKLQAFFHSKGIRFTATTREFGPESEKMDADVEAIMAETDPEKRKQMMSDLVDYLVDQQFFIATGSQDYTAVATKDLTDFYVQWNTSARALVFADLKGR